MLVYQRVYHDILNIVNVYNSTNISFRGHHNVASRLNHVRKLGDGASQWDDLQGVIRWTAQAFSFLEYGDSL